MLNVNSVDISESSKTLTLKGIEERLNRRLFKRILLSSIFIAFLLLIKPSYMFAKSVLAQVLLDHAWQASQLNVKDGTEQKQLPWGWADSYPVAKLTYIKADKAKNKVKYKAKSKQENKQGYNKAQAEVSESWIILAGMTGRTMAFAPAWLEDSAKPNQYGNTVISAHNDSHFRGLENSDIGDTFIVEDRRGVKRNYRVISINIQSEHDTSPYLFQDETMITLINCYPFEVTNSVKTQRLVIQAVSG